MCVGTVFIKLALIYLCGNSGNPTLEFQTLDLIVVETEKLHIPVPFRAVPSPRITWHKDGKELKGDERVGFRSAQPRGESSSSLCLVKCYVFPTETSTLPVTWRLRAAFMLMPESTK